MVEHGPLYGYKVETDKTWYGCKVEDKEVAIEAFRSLGLEAKMSSGRDYLGGFVGGTANKQVWLGNKCAMWVQAVSMLAKIDVKYPQTAYAGFCLCI